MKDRRTDRKFVKYYYELEKKYIQEINRLRKAFGFPEIKGLPKGSREKILANRRGFYADEIFYDCIKDISQKFKGVEIILDHDNITVEISNVDSYVFYNYNLAVDNNRDEYGKQIFEVESEEDIRKRKLESMTDDQLREELHNINRRKMDEYLKYNGKLNSYARKKLVEDIIKLET
jgi:hypothetical protein